MLMQIVTPVRNQQSVIKSATAVFLLLCVLLPTSNGNYISPFVSKPYLKSENSSNVNHDVQKFPRRTLMQELDWRYIGFYMAFCDTDDDCSEVGPHMICSEQRCECKPDFIPIERLKFMCYPKATIFGPCELTQQCTAMNQNTYCNPSNRCTCSLNYYFDGRVCAVRGDSHNLKAQEVYKAAVVAAACFIVAIVGIFVACIVRRSFCRREHHIQQSTSRNSDVFSISDEIAALRAVDKPPSYEEVLQIERTFYGIPPPEYTVSRSENLPARTPMTFSSVQTNNFDQCRPPRVFPESSGTPSGNAALLTDGFKNTVTAYLPQRHQEPQDHTPSTGFLATVDVLSPSLNSVPGTPDPSVSSQFQNVSLTPPPRLQQPPFVLTHSLSSSLPSSPVLRSHKLDSPFQLRRALLKQKQQTSVLSPASPSGSSSSSPGAASCHSLESANKKASTVAAYDNPGFLSDSQDLNNSV